VKFIDVAQIKVESGSGGDGCVAFRREKGVPRGGPNGGNGGSGGSVYLVASSKSSTLQDFRYKRKYSAEKGSQGEGWNRSGSAGIDLVIPVPCGTSIINNKTGELVIDLVEPGQEIQIVKGGKGGKGNYEFRNARNQTPSKATPGKLGISMSLKMELKLIADIGLIGMPNAGKSTLLGHITSAKPKIADYPFTTLVPNLGIVDLGDFTSCTIADIPGLIEGASEGKGLGLEFLKHVERTRALVYLIDVNDPAPAATLSILHQELEAYGNRLPELPFVVALNKIDLVYIELIDDILEEITEWTERRNGAGVHVISAVTGQGIDKLRYAMKDLYQKVMPE
jgi:GTPase